MTVRLLTPSDNIAWDEYVYKHPDAMHAHLVCWKDVIEKSYGKKGYYLIAEENDKIVGLLPLFHIKSFLFGDQLVSMPYLTYGGIISDSDDVCAHIIKKALEIIEELKSDVIELRCAVLPNKEIFNFETDINTSKVSMRLKLPSSAEELFKSFKSKLRSQIRRPEKEGMTFTIGNSELVDDFYKVFVVTMRDLGSPVHSLKLFKNIVHCLKETIKISVVYHEGKPVAAGLITIFKNFVEIPWASSLRKYNRLSPNMMLYWSLLEYCSSSGFEWFDFGRSTPGEGTYKFKEQWGAKPLGLNWVQLSNKVGLHQDNSLNFGTSLKELMTSTWSKLPVPVASWLGKKIRKNISL